MTNVYEASTAVLEGLKGGLGWHIVAMLGGKAGSVEGDYAAILETMARRYNRTPAEIGEVYGARINECLIWNHERAHMARHITETRVSEGYVYGSWLRPLGSWSRELLEHGKVVDLERTELTPHAYLVTDVRVPDDVVSAYELTLIASPE